MGAYPAVRPLTFVCWRWKPDIGYRSKFGAETVNVLASMLSRNYHGPHELVCVTDDYVGIDKSIRTMPLWDDFSTMKSPHGRGYPSCYRRLRMWSAEAASWFGPSFVSIDLDVVITGDLTPLFQHDHDVKMWGDVAKNTPYNGSLIQLKAGTRTKVWTDFDPVASPRRTLAMGMVGSDQAWIGACLGPNEPKWSTRDGVYSYRNHIQRGCNYQLPAGARIVILHGAHDPWGPQAQCLSWVRKFYR